ncbi:MAG: gentisate 1,2-dioxygenase [Alphaproteobacteria bacterium]|nr:gentisate 1,2-dioxygenase [Alphaproteobacteria bacterium]
MAKAERQAYYDRIGADSLAPLWEVLHNLVPKEPPRTCAAHIWHYDKIRHFVLEAGDLITAEEAERRVLVLENPGLQGTNQVTPSLYAGLQLILPGEIAPSHRHTQSALRFVIEGDGAYTAVDGERTIMHEGDFVITPPWTWHDHGNESDRPMVWMDGLDVPLVNYLDAGFAEKYPEAVQPIGRPVGDAPARYGQGLLPDGYQSGSLCSPIFNYRYDRTRAALETMRRTEDWDPCHGLKMRYVNPVDGGWAMPTMGTSIQLLPKGFATTPYRSTDATVFSAVEGKGRLAVGDVTLEWGPRDVFVVPAWAWNYFEADEDAVVFSFSNRPVQEKLGLFREQRGNAED